MRLILVLFCILLAGCSCSLLPASKPEKELRVLTWNVQNLFDEAYDGDEYPEFDPRKAWTREAFWQRCAALAEVVKGSVAGGPDVVALQEVENAHAVEVLRDRFLGGMGYDHLVVPPSQGENIRPVFLSRYPVVRTALHYPASLDGSPQRPILEAEWAIGSRSLVLLNNHWKSRVPDPRQTEAQRRQDALALDRRLAELSAREDGPLVIALGDFNASKELSLDFTEPCMKKIGPDSPNEADGPQPCLAVGTSRSAVASSPVGLYDLWEEKPSGSPGGSYYYQGTWSKLDHVFLPAKTLACGEWSVGDFKVVTLPSQMNADGQPRAWSVKDKAGISDHFPLAFTLHLVE